MLGATVGDTLNLFDNGLPIGTMVVTQANTKWDLPTLSNGVHNLSITETNASGTSVPLFLQMTVDAPVAPAPVLQGMIDHSISNYADVGAGHNFFDANPSVVLGTVAGDMLKFYDNGTLIGSVVATSTNTMWTLPTLVSGEHHLSVTQTNASGIASAAMTVDFTASVAPVSPAPVLQGMIDHSISNYADVGAGHNFFDANPSVVLGTVAGDMLKFYDNGTLIGSVVATSTNTMWTLPTLVSGEHHLSVTQTNASGIASAAMTVDFTASVAPVVPAPVLQGMIDHSISNYADVGAGHNFFDANPSVVLGTVAGDMLKFYDNGTLIGSVVATSTNTMWTLPTLVSGEHHLSVTQTNASGIASAAMTVDFTASVAPVVPAPVLQGMIDHSISNYADVGAGHNFFDANPSVVLGTVAGDMLKFYDNGTLIGSVVATSTNTMWTLPTLVSGEHHLSVTQTNASGIASAAMTVDFTASVAPVAPAVQSPVSAVHAAAQDITAVSNDASVGLHEKFVASAAHQNVDLNVDPALYFKQSSAHVEGGSTGAHTTHLEGSHQVLDLTSLTGQTAAAKISGIQAFDLGGHGNALHLSLVDVLNLGQADLFQHDGNKQLMVNGSSADTVDLSHVKLAGVADAPWVEHGTASVGGVTYNVYQDSAAHADLLVQQGVHTVVH